jgi:hypothetical protein
MIRKIPVALLAVVFLCGAPYSRAFFAPGRTMHPLKRREAKTFAKILAGFNYSGAFDCPDLEVPTHGVDVLAFPNQFVADKCYVFHLPSDAAYSPAEAVIKRLRENQVELKRYPRTPQDFVYLMVGGPLFRIDFRNDGRDGSILAMQGTHGQAPSTSRWKPDDYVLVFNKR